MREGKLSPPFWTGSYCPGGRGPRRVNRVNHFGWSLVFPGNFGKESGGDGPKNSKTSPRGRGDNLYVGSKFFEKPPPKGPLSGSPQ
jgi:hypothetical protein